jgi:hypothetical protein
MRWRSTLRADCTALLVATQIALAGLAALAFAAATIAGCIRASATHDRQGPSAGIRHAIKFQRSRVARAAVE